MLRMPGVSRSNPIMLWLCRSSVQAARRAGTVEITPMGVQAQRDAAHMLDQKSILNRLDHAHCDVRVPPQQIVHVVREDKLDFQFGVPFTQG